MARTASRLTAILVAAMLLLPLASPSAFAKPGDGIMLLQSYSTKPAELLLGEEFELRLSLHNAGSKKAEDVLLTLGEGGGVGGSLDSTGAGGGVGGGGGTGGASSLVVVGGGNTKHLERLGGKEDATVSFRLLSDPSGTPGLVALPVTIEYSCDGRRILSQTVGVVLRRPTRLRVISMSAPADAVVGEPFTVSAEVMNAGDAKVSSVGLRLACDTAELEGAEVFLGNLEPGDGDVLETEATLTKTGTATITLTIEYLDEFGDTRETTKTVEVQASAAASETAEVVDEEGGGGFFAAIGGFFRALFGLGE